MVDALPPVQYLADQKGKDVPVRGRYSYRVPGLVDPCPCGTYNVE